VVWVGGWVGASTGALAASPRSHVVPDCGALSGAPTPSGGGREAQTGVSGRALGEGGREHSGDEGGRKRAQAAFDDIISDALALGGTVTGERGIGLLKMAGLREELDEPVLDMQRAIKAALDPHGILNPGKVLGPR
jgi:FAD linked oxidases, C-terminal domain